MRRNARSAFYGLALACLAACGGSPEPVDKDAARERGRDTDETVFDDMIQTQDKARAVEGVTLGHKADMDAAIEQSEGDGAKDQE
jgi:hypothetical protein